MTYTKAIVTGGAGFIGSHLVDALVADGVAVTVFDKVDVLPDRKNDAATYVTMDIKDDGLRAAFADVQPDVVFHLAAHVDDRESVRQPVMNAEENVLGSLNVFEAARLADAKKIVFTSTGVVYGNADVLPIAESAPAQPLTPYAVSKLTGERYLNFYFSLYKLPYVALRLSNVYGPRQDGSKECGAIAIFTSRLLKGEAVEMNNDGKTTRDYVYVADVVAALIAAATSNEVGVMNIGTGVQTTTDSVLAAVVHEVDMTPTVTQCHDVMDAVKHVALDASAAKAKLGWVPTVAFADGVAKTVAWYKNTV